MDLNNACHARKIASYEAKTVKLNIVSTLNCVYEKTKNKSRFILHRNKQYNALIVTTPITEPLRRLKKSTMQENKHKRDSQ